MDKIILHLFDARKHTLSELFSLTKVNEEGIAFLSKFKNIDVKKEKLISYYLKKKYVGEYSHNEYGKPISDNIFFNVSNSKGVVLLATCQNHDIGVDIEILRPNDESLIKYTTNEQEYAYIKNEVDFLSIWTSKESLMKCIGTGIRNKIKEIPALPLNAQKVYNGQNFFNKTFKYNDYIISITTGCDEEFEYNLINEEF